MSSGVTFRQLESTLKEVQRLLKCSICSKTVRGSTRVLPCKHVACEKCHGKCCGKLVKINRNHLRSDVQEFTQLFSNLLSASVEERKGHSETSMVNTRTKPEKDNVTEADSNSIAKPLDNSTTGKENATDKSAKKAKTAVPAAATEELHESPVVQAEGLVETPLDLSAPAGPRKSFVRKSLVVGSSNSWMPLDLSGKPAVIQQVTTNSGFQPRIHGRSYTAPGVYLSELNDCGLLPPSGMLVSSSPFIPQMDNPREENGNMKRKKNDNLEQKERKKSKLQSNIPEVNTTTSNKEIPMEVDAIRAEQPPQQKPESSEVLPVEVSPVKNGTIVRTDDNWNNDEEIILSSPAKLAGTAQPNRGEQANTASSGDPFDDGEDMDFCFQTPDSKCGKDVLADRKDESPKQVKSATPKLQATPNRPSSAHKKLDQVKTPPLSKVPCSPIVDFSTLAFWTTTT